jgi:GTP-binding protein
VIFIGSHDVNTLIQFRHTPRIIAPNGENGKIKDQYGANAEPIIFYVPLGTLIRNKKTNQVLRQCQRDREQYIAARGGRG